MSEQFRKMMPYETYQEAKGQLWGLYMSNITPALKEHQALAVATLEKLKENKKLSRPTAAKKLAASMIDYCNLSIDEFTKYLFTLQTVYLGEKFNEIGSKQKFITEAIEKQLAKKVTKPAKKKAAKKPTKPKAKAIKNLELKPSKKYNRYMNKKFGIKNSKKSS